VVTLRARAVDSERLDDNAGALMNRRYSILIALSTVATLAACSSDKKSDSTSATTSPAVTAGSVTSTDAGTDGTTPAGTATTGTGAAPDANSPLCKQITIISDYDKSASALVASNPSFADYQKFLVDTTPGVVTAYAEASSIDPSMAADFTALSNVTAAVATAAASATDTETLQAALLTLPNLTAAGEAGQRLNTYAQANCGVNTAGN
jgi:hypothetical protein